MNLPKPLLLTNCYLDCTELGVQLTLINAMGVLLDELPGDDDYRQPLSL